MVALCKEKALYVKCCIIPNGITDSQGDTLYKEDIKKIFTSFNNQDNFEIYHNDLPIQEVSLLENYISTADETIGTQIVPSGSWNAVIRVDNPDIQEGLLTGEFGGVSLNNRIAPKCSAGLSGQVRYQDIADAECVIPLLISFVKRGANGYGLHVMDYPVYIQKSDDSGIKNGAKKMAFNLLDSLKSLVKEAEASENEEPVILKEDDEATNEATAEQTVDEPQEQAEIKKEDASAEEKEDEKEEDDATIEKEDDAIASLEERILSLETRISELESKLDSTEETEEEEKDETDEDTPKITKSASKVINTSNDETQIQNTNYFELTGRDPLTGLPKQ